MLTTIKVWLKSAKWLLWLVLLVAVFAAAFLLRGFFIRRRGDDAGPPALLPAVPKAIKARADKAYEEAVRAKIEASAAAAQQQGRLEEIGKIDDGRERRRRLAELLRQL